MFGILAWLGCALFSKASEVVDNANLMSTPVSYCGKTPIYRNRQGQYFIDGTPVYLKLHTDLWGNRYIRYDTINGHTWATEYSDVVNRIERENEERKKQAIAGGYPYYNYEFPYSHRKTSVEVATGRMIAEMWWTEEDKCRMHYKVYLDADPDDLKDRKERFRNGYAFVPKSIDDVVWITEEEFSRFKYERGVGGKRKNEEMGVDPYWMYAHLRIKQKEEDRLFKTIESYTREEDEFTREIMYLYPECFSKERRRKAGFYDGLGR